MSRHDEPIFDDELLEQRMERAIHSITESQRVDKVTGDYILRRLFVITPFLNENERSRLVRHLLWRINTR